ncbi:hypothetical protein FRB95_000505 [Tulasnella sp. JGI-2019a]|nr:hypothetical protein FRB95_000505 [Tulasnella sp. JGI-2019a]
MSSTVDGDIKPPTLKPLPELPSETSASGSGPPLLTVPALSHLRCLLAEGLQEEKLDIAWLLPLESSIHDLMKAVRKERWLTGAVKTRRGWSNLESDPKSPPQERESHATETSDDGIENQIRKAVDAVINPPQAEDLATQALSHLHERISKPTPPSEEPNRCHLLLTLAPPKLIRPFPDLGVNFDLRPHREGCTFTLGQFSLPLFDDKQAGGSTILAGFEEWKDLVTSKKSPSFWTTVNIVGGKFTLNGVTSPSEHASLSKVLRLGVYCALAMQLELSLQKDSGVILRYPPPPVVRPPPVKIMKPLLGKDPAGSPPPSGSTTTRPSRRSTKTASGIWGFLARKTNEVIGRPSQGTGSDVSTQPEQPGQAVILPPPIPSSSSNQAPSSHQPSPISAHFPRVSMDLVRTLSNEMKLSWSDNFVQSSGPARPDHAPGTLFSVLVDRIKADNVVLSTSPEVRFPPPSLLLQLAQRELAVTNSKASSSSPPLSPTRSHAALRLTGDDRTGLGCILGWSGSGHAVIGLASSVEAMATEMTGTNAFLRHQSLTVLYAEHVPAEPDPALKDLVKQEKRGRGNNEKGKEKEHGGSETDRGKLKEVMPSESSKGDMSTEDSESRITTSTSATAESTISKATTPNTDPNVSSIVGSESPPITKVHPATKLCITAHWRTSRYFSRSHDHSLGEFIVKTCSAAERGDTCEVEGCGKSRKLHGMDWVHAAVKVVGTLSDAESESLDSSSLEKDILMWSSCGVCKLETKKVPLSDGSFLLSFSKYLELLIYSTAFTTLNPSLCDHTTPPPDAAPPAPGLDAGLPTAGKYPTPGLPSTRFNIQHHFQHRSTVLNFTLSPIDSDIFEVKVPRIQITKAVGEVKKMEESQTAEDPEPSGDKESQEDKDKEELRLEITDWWLGLKGYLGTLEEFIAGEALKWRKKQLPRTPRGSEDEGVVETPSESTPRPSELSSAPHLPVPSTGSTSILFSLTPPGSSISLRSTATPPATDSQCAEHLRSLDELRQAFQACELSLYKKLSETAYGDLNNVRRQFHASALTAKRRINAWRAKRITNASAAAGSVEEFDSKDLDPPWFDKTSHVISGSRVVVREKDWGSIIAFTLSSNDYKRELVAMASGAPTSALKPSNSSTQEIGKISTSSTPSTLSIATQESKSSSKLPIQMTRKMSGASTTTATSNATGNLKWSTDDEDWDVWPTSNEQHTAIITRKEHPKDTTGILSLRDVLRQQRTVEPSPSPSGLAAGAEGDMATSGGITSRFSSLGNSASKLIRLGIAPLAVAASATDVEPTNTSPMLWAKPETQLAMQPAEGEFKVSGVEFDQGTVSTGESILSSLLEQEAARKDEDQTRDPLGFSIITHLDASSKESSPVGYSTIKVSPSKFVRAPSAVEETSEEEQSLAASMSATSSKSSQTVSGKSALNGPTTWWTPPLQQQHSKPSTSHSKQGTDETIAPPVPPKDDLPTDHSRTPSSEPSGTSPDNENPGEHGSSGVGKSASTQGSISSTFASAFRYVLGVPVSGSSPKHHYLLGLHHHHHHPHGSHSTLYPPIDEKPHLKYEVTLDKKVKFSCTVYYARQFDFLRKQCGVDAGGSGSGSGHSEFDYGMIKSLERCVGWSAEGGKSKSSFLKSEDDRYIIKTLVNAWNVADLQVLLELAPSYFRYMDSTANHASVLAKLMGFYTIEIQGLDPKGGSGSTKMRADLLVMENLFCNFNIAPGRTFDLKGIAGRKVKPAATTAVAAPVAKENGVEDKGKEREGPKDVGRRRTRAAVSKPAATAVQKPLFDGEWIEGQQKAMVLVEPHSKAILKEAMKNDAEFLARSNIMDYSLLLGIDQERRQIACGLVDTIGSYTFAKTLEYKAKQGLTGNSGREVTVVPPAEYQERFVNAMEGYFFACPDKWSKPTSGSACHLEALDDLPSVF